MGSCGNKGVAHTASSRKGMALAATAAGAGMAGAQFPGSIAEEALQHTVLN